MEHLRDEYIKIRELLRKHPHGMSVTEVSQALGKNKHSTGRYLDGMYAAGLVEMRMFGKAKIYSPSYRVPLASLISKMEERIMILDSDLRLLVINDACLELLGKKSGDLAGQDLRYVEVADSGVHDLLSVLVGKIGDSEQVLEYPLYLDGGEVIHLHIHIVPSLDEAHHAVYVIVMVDITEEVRMIQELREREHQYRELVEMADAIILKLDKNGNVLFFNEFAETFFGYSKEEVLGRSVIGTIVPPEEYSGRDLKELIAQVCTDTDSYRRNENANITKDGRLVWVRWSNRAIRNEEDQVIGVLSVGNDISDRKEMELALLSQKDQLERKFQEIECIQRFSGTINSVMTLPAILQELVRVIAKCWSKRGPTGVRITYAGNVYESGIPDGLPFIFSQSICAGEREVGSFEVGFGGRNEEAEYYENKERLLSMFAEKIGFAIEWMEAETKVRMERDLSDKILATVDAAIFVLDPEGRILRFNRRSEELTGCLEKEVLGSYIWDMFDPAGLSESVRSYVSTLVETKRGSHIRGAWTGRDQIRRTIDWSNSVVCDDAGVVTHIISTGLDVTRQVEGEAELRRCKSVLDRLLAGEEPK
ncbi:PAS domain S-box protein [Methanocalculus taiwanensis]|uniref:PAS domain S-box protein n=1 Tax=Methanocalculus taiwanensis TaxID=106207 RepID=A0ABD4TJ41_9EURY|nr:PAS domain S-box protein [Methanocalculus taiwanensis]MCQ1538711.1 PAS domain S-box protein [Methanocalculus taiwanensis]